MFEESTITMMEERIMIEFVFVFGRVASLEMEARDELLVGFH
jgi:hypothetical protein